jgi:ribonuclease BN (tRNA processing enzyme)
MKTTNKRSSILVFILLLVFASPLAAQETKLKWFGHAAFSIVTPGGKVLLIDPWLNNPSNPEAKDGQDPLVAIPKVDYILLTHGHRDHVGDAVLIAKKTGAALIANPELAGNLAKLSDFPAKQVDSRYIMQMGNEIQIADGEVMIAMTAAVHSSSVFNAKAGPNEPERAYGGSPAGFVIYRLLQGHGAHRRELPNRCRPAQYQSDGSENISKSSTIRSSQVSYSPSLWHSTRNAPHCRCLHCRTQETKDRFL